MAKTNTDNAKLEAAERADLIAKLMGRWTRAERPERDYLTGRIIKAVR